MRKDEKNISFVEMFTFLIIVLFLECLVQKAIRKKFNIPKEPKYISTGHQLTTYRASFIYGAAIIVFNMNGWFVYTAAICVFLAFAMISTFVISYYYGREEKRHYISIGSFIALVPIIIVCIICFL